MLSKNRLFLIIMGAIVTASVMLTPRMPNIRTERRLMLPTVFIAAIGVWVWQRSKVLACLLWYTAAVLWWSYANVTFTPGVMILSALAIYLVVSETFPKWKQHLEIVYDIICGLALLNVFFLGMQALGIDPLFSAVTKGETVRVGMQANDNEVSAYLAICLPAFFRARRWWFIPLIAWGLWQAKTTNGVIAALAVSGAYLFFTYAKSWKKRVVYGTAIVVTAGLLLGTYMTVGDKFIMAAHQNNRLMTWKRTLQFAEQRFFGWGFGQYQYIMPTVTAQALMPESQREWLWANIGDQKGVGNAVNEIVGIQGMDPVAQKAARRAWLFNPSTNAGAPPTEAHNEYLELLFAAGLPALLLGLIFAVASLIRGFRQNDLLPALGFMAALATACFFFTFQIVPLMIVSVVWLGLINRRTA